MRRFAEKARVAKLVHQLQPFVDQRHHDNRLAKCDLSVRGYPIELSSRDVCSCGEVKMLRRHSFVRILSLLVIGYCFASGSACQLYAGGSAGLVPNSIEASAESTSAHHVGFLAAKDSWRHTSMGWERLEDFEIRIPEPCDPWCNITQLHPAVVAAFVTIVSLGALCITSSEAVISYRSEC